jgi:energy-coupling factor transporter ATP-binding protein EcfA2
MSRAWDEERRQLLDGLVRMGDSGRAEGAPADQLAGGFYPVAEHLRLLDADVVLVVGPRGSGKTQIRRMLTDAGLSHTIARYAPRVRLPQRTQWLEAYPGRRDVFEGNGLRHFLREHGNDHEAMRDVWLAYLLRRLNEHLLDSERKQLTQLFTPAPADIAGIHQAFQKLGPTPIVVLDSLDQRLESAGEHLFVTYDELDTLGLGEWSAIETGIRGLVALWAAYTRRWQHLRAKLFIRTDLYDRHARAGGADLYKLAASRVELNWSDRDLYAMLLKRIANASDDLADYLKSAKGIDWTEDDRLGQTPFLKRWDDARPAIERMVGPYMGANQKKGLVYRWLLDHVRDGLGRAYPRPLVQMLELAAAKDREQADTLKKPRLLHPSSLRSALDRVSDDHVLQTRDELIWLDTIKSHLANNPLVPYTDKEILALLNGIDTTEEPKPPYFGKELLDYLIELGILRRRSDRRVDAPDLFLNGLGLRRKGGVRRGK